MSRKKLEPRICRYCKREFQPRHYRQHYCNETCSNTMVNLIALQLQNRQGEYYDKWIAGLLNAGVRAKAAQRS